MSDRDPSSGGLTGATGDLTPDESGGDFEPGERREVSGSPRHADVTQAQARHAAEHADRTPDEAERDARVGGDEREDHEDHF
jgi:hypothetical protein